MVRQERAVRTRRAILEAAAVVFDERGYDAATIAEILAHAGVTKGALYFHFSSKLELAQGVLDAQFDKCLVPPRASKLQELVDVAMVLAYRMKYEPMLSAGARLSLGPDTLEMRGGAVPGWIEILRKLLCVAKEQGELLPDVDPAETAWILSACWSGVQLYSQTLNDRADIEGRVATLYRHVLPGIATPAMLSRLDMADDRGRRVVAEVATRAARAARAGAGAGAGAGLGVGSEACAVPRA
ncbi:TetR/AcrR family transcriptional regulator (plasmid) [Streptomyces sp. NBC_00435]|uniref:ScbR family autoregulator-binding transcription factor n=1 Tax=Streptomyces sp. NBC_00435 TaxID=2903649 RepID=UPI002E2142AB